MENSIKMLEVIDLEVHYNKIKAVKGISLEVYKGEIVALLGANGAGKSTTLFAISGIVAASNGKVLYDGMDLRTVRAEDIVRKGLAMVPEGRHIYPSLSVYDNLQAGAITRKDKKGIANTLTQIYDLFPRLKERTKQLAGTLSGGEQQMLTIGRALMSEPKLLLLDEPSLGISPILTEQIFETIKRINEAGTTILLVEQNAAIALELAKRAYVLETGNIALSGDSVELSSNDEVKKAYLGG